MRTKNELVKDKYLKEIKYRVKRLNRMTDNEKILQLMKVLEIKTDLDGNIINGVI